MNGEEFQTSLATDSTSKSEIIVEVFLKIIIIIILLLLLLLLLLTSIEFSLGGSSPHTSTDKTNKNKYT